MGSGGGSGRKNYFNSVNSITMIIKGLMSEIYLCRFLGSY